MLEEYRRRASFSVERMRNVFEDETCQNYRVRAFSSVRSKRKEILFLGETLVDPAFQSDLSPIAVPAGDRRVSSGDFSSLRRTEQNRSFARRRTLRYAETENRAGTMFSDVRLVVSRQVHLAHHGFPRDDPQIGN